MNVDRTWSNETQDFWRSQFLEVSVLSRRAVRNRGPLCGDGAPPQNAHLNATEQHLQSHLPGRNMHTLEPSGRPPSLARRPETLGSHTAALVAISAAAMAACAKVGEDVFNHEAAPFDEPIRAWVLAHQALAARRAFRLITRVGAPSVVVPFTAVTAAWLWRRRGLPIAGAIVLAPAVATALFLAIKRVYRRARPAGGARLHELTYAFPSGHATAAAAVFPTLAYVLWREDLMSAESAATLGSVAPLAIGTSRVYLDVHWATDVLGGWSVGVLVAALGAVVYERVRRNTRERGRPAR